MNNHRTTGAAGLAGLALIARPFIPAEYQPLLDPAVGVLVALFGVLAKDK